VSAARLSAARKARASRPSRRRTPPSRSKRATVTGAAPEHDGRERILAVAIRAFSELGYEGTTTAGIARAAGVTQPLVHHHFGSKEGLWRAAMDRLFANVPRFHLAVDAEAAPAAFLAFVEPFVRFVAAHPEATRVIAREGATPSPRLDYLVERHVGAPFREIVASLRAGQDGGLLAPEICPELLLFFVLGAGSHLFDVTAFAKRSVGIVAAAPRTLDDFIGLVRTVLEQGLFRR
jgi:AcrR family transcriptional regulator